MPKRRADAASRRFLDQFTCVKVSRLRADGTIDPAKRNALIPFPNGRIKLIGTAHTRLKYGGGFSYFICPKCARITSKLFLIDDAPLCWQCCEALNIVHRSRYGFGRDERRRARDKVLDELIAKVESNERLTFKPVHPALGGRRAILANSRRLKRSIRERLVKLRLHQLASQQTSGKPTQGYQPLAETRQLINIDPIWRASSTERLNKALDKAQQQIINALKSDDPAIRTLAARLMLRTKQARDLGLA